MFTLIKKFCPLFALLLLFTAADLSFLTADADARGRSGGRSSSFRSTPAQRQAPQQAKQTQQNQDNRQQQGGFAKGFMGGLLGAGIGGLLFGSMFGMGGSGFGILPLLLLGGAGYFVYRRFVRKD